MTRRQSLSLCIEAPQLNKQVAKRKKPVCKWFPSSFIVLLYNCVRRALQNIFYQPLDDVKASSNTIHALWNMRDHVAYVHNIMSSILDMLESTKNVLNWTNPSKTFPIYVGVIILWLICVLVPGRYLVLLGKDRFPTMNSYIDSLMIIAGLQQFFYKFLPGESISCSMCL